MTAEGFLYSEEATFGTTATWTLRDASILLSAGTILRGTKNSLGIPVLALIS